MLILKLVPRSVATSFQNLPAAAFILGGGRDMRPAAATADHHHHHHHLIKTANPNHRRGFSGAIVRAEGGRQSGFTGANAHHHHGEPCSPKVSCMGQLKQNSSISSKKKKKKKDKDLVIIGSVATEKSSPAAARRVVSPLHGRRWSDASAADKAPPPLPPSLGQMKRFASSRETLRSYCSDNDDYECCPSSHHLPQIASLPSSIDDVVLPNNDVVLRIGETTPRKEINLWKRRIMMMPPQPAFTSLLDNYSNN
ncbi:unnamed protein product [Cuscuta campestris]|uniref:Uncharacterized protein n=1 Tax=Cuscuta campestris TaxID=132261 RepID=A0A484LEW8_9ASTE|nr:unnamed protein product [Cuscuta campestris]